LTKQRSYRKREATKNGRFLRLIQSSAVINKGKRYTMMNRITHQQKQHADLKSLTDAVVEAYGLADNDLKRVVGGEVGPYNAQYRHHPHHHRYHPHHPHHRNHHHSQVYDRDDDNGGYY
jgi:hypothetical protein